MNRSAIIVFWITYSWFHYLGKQSWYDTYLGHLILLELDFNFCFEFSIEKLDRVLNGLISVRFVSLPYKINPFCILLHTPRWYTIVQSTPSKRVALTPWDQQHMIHHVIGFIQISRTHCVMLHTLCVRINKYSYLSYEPKQIFISGLSSIHFVIKDTTLMKAYESACLLFWAFTCPV